MWRKSVGNMRRYFVKSTTIYTVYDSVTGTVIGDSFDREVNKAIMKPRGLHIEDKADSATFKVSSANEQAFHSAVSATRFGRVMQLAKWSITG